MRLSRAGFRVPDGAVLPASWFSACWAELEKTDAWSRFEATNEAPWTTHCEALKTAAGRLPFSNEMRAGLEELQMLVRTNPSQKIMARPPPANGTGGSAGSLRPVRSARMDLAAPQP